MTQRRRRLGLLLAVAAAAVVVGLIVMRRAAPHPSVQLAAPRASAPASAVEGKSVEAASAASANMPAAHPLDVCAQPQLAKQTFKALMESPLGPGISALWQQQAQSLRQLAMARLLSSGRDDERVAGLMLQDDAEGIARLAASTEDPAAYAIAWKVCKNPFFGSSPAAVASGAVPLAKPAACSSLSLERWVQLAPGNAVPWLELASAAQQRGDVSGVVNSLHRAGRAETLDAGFGWLAGMVTRQLPADAFEGGQLQLGIELIGQEAAMVDTGRGIVTKLCDARSIADSNQRQQCEQVAQMMMGRSRDMLDVAIGLSLAERLKLPASERPVTRENLREAQAVAVSFYAGTPGREGICDTVRDANQWMADLARLGEWRALKARMAADSKR